MNQKRIFWMVLLLLVASLDISLIRNLEQNHGVYREQSQLLDEEEALAQLRAFVLPQDAFASLTGQKKKRGGVMEKADTKADARSKEEEKEGKVGQGNVDEDEGTKGEDEAPKGKVSESEAAADEVPKGKVGEGEAAADEVPKGKVGEGEAAAEKVQMDEVYESAADQEKDPVTVGKGNTSADRGDAAGGNTAEEEDEKDADVSWKFSFGFNFDLNKQKDMMENILAYLFCQSLEADELEQWRENEQKLAPKLYEDYTKYVRNLLADAVYFPIPEASNDAHATVSYENSWQSERTYGGTRGHEGCDLMASVQQRGYYPVVSVSDGVVEKMGWLPQGGYRIGIRSRHGVYYYYAHLAEYEDGMEEGVQVAAGQLIGYMGDTGYSEVEGTTGNFPVHLHFGMYLDLEGLGEVSFNPYYLLGLLEENKLRYIYENESG